VHVPWAPPAAEGYKRSDVIQISLQVPGMTGDDFDSSVIDNNLVVHGDKHLNSERQQGRFHVMECACGRFERAIELPTLFDDSQARARYRNGILTVTLPKDRAAIRC